MCHCQLSSSFCITVCMIVFVGLAITGCQREPAVASPADEREDKNRTSKKDIAKPPKKAPTLPSPKKRRAAYDRFNKYSSKPLAVREPIEVIMSDIYADGGTTIVKFRDAAKREFIAKLPSDWGAKPVEKDAYLFGPAGKPLKKLTIGSREGRALCGVMIRWAKNQPPFWLLLSADRESWRNWHGYVHNPNYQKPFGIKLYYRNRALVFTFSMLLRQIRQMERQKDM